MYYVKQKSQWLELLKAFAIGILTGILAYFGVVAGIYAIIFAIELQLAMSLIMTLTSGAYLYTAIRVFTLKL